MCHIPIFPVVTCKDMGTFWLEMPFSGVAGHWVFWLGVPLDFDWADGLFLRLTLILMFKKMGSFNQQWPHLINWVGFIFHKLGRCTLKQVKAHSKIPRNPRTIPGSFCLRREEHSMDQYRSRQKLSENFERHWSIRISGQIHMDQSLVYIFSWRNSCGPMVLKVFLKFPPTLVLVHGWLFPVMCIVLVFFFYFDPSFKTFISCCRTPDPRRVSEKFQKGFRGGFWRGLWRVFEGF